MFFSWNNGDILGMRKDNNNFSTFLTKNEQNPGDIVPLMVPRTGCHVTWTLQWYSGALFTPNFVWLKGKCHGNFTIFWSKLCQNHY